MSDITTHLDTIRDIDGTGYRRGRERKQALDAIAEEVADALLTGRHVPFYKDVEGFFGIKGFAEAVASAIVSQGNAAVDQRYTLAKHVEEKGVEHGREAARILREMNAQSAVLPWEPSADDMFTGCEALGGITALPNAEAMANVSAAQIKLKVEELKAAQPTRQFADLVDEAIAELGSNPGTDAITHVLPVDNCWVEMKVERVEDEDTGPEYDTVSQDDIRWDDIVEYHDGETVTRWLVRDVVVRRKKHSLDNEPYQVQLELLDGLIRATETVTLPLPGDPFILRPRS